MGGNDEVQVEVGRLVLLKHGLDALDAGHHADLVQVGHNGGGAVLEHALGEGADGQVGAFRMDVPVDEAGRDEHALRVDDLRALADAVIHIAQWPSRSFPDGCARR